MVFFIPKQLSVSTMRNNMIHLSCRSPNPLLFAFHTPRMLLQKIYSIPSPIPIIATFSRTNPIFNPFPPMPRAIPIFHPDTTPWIRTQPLNPLRQTTSPLSTKTKNRCQKHPLLSIHFYQIMYIFFKYFLFPLRFIRTYIIIYTWKGGKQIE